MKKTLFIHIYLNGGDKIASNRTYPFHSDFHARIGFELVTRPIHSSLEDDLFSRFIIAEIGKFPLDRILLLIFTFVITILRRVC